MHRFFCPPRTRRRKCCGPGPAHLRAESAPGHHPTDRRREVSLEGRGARRLCAVRGRERARHPRRWLRPLENVSLQGHRRHRRPLSERAAHPACCHLLASARDIRLRGERLHRFRPHLSGPPRNHTPSVQPTTALLVCHHPCPRGKGGGGQQGERCCDFKQHSARCKSRN